jgi:ATP-citrate lyase beta-subunit
MAHRGIREYDAKRMIAENISRYSRDVVVPSKLLLVSSGKGIRSLGRKDWVRKGNLTVKPDQLFGGRGKSGLVKLKIGCAEAERFIKNRLGKFVSMKGRKDRLTHFLVEPYVEHSNEYFLSIKTEREGDVIYFSRGGGIDVEENWDKVKEIRVGILESIDDIGVEKKLGDSVPPGERKKFANFIKAMYKFFVDYGFVYIETNPFTFMRGKFAILDVVAKLDDTAAFEKSEKWGEIEFPEPFGKKQRVEEGYISNLDKRSGASLKLTVLNPEGRLWTMVAGGGASVVYSDTVSDMGFAKELANYGEYSGDPSEDETFEYAKTIIDLMTRKAHPKGKALIIGGGIANFTNVANTFKGIIRAISMSSDTLKRQKVRIYVRRGGPNYKEGLGMMEKLGNELCIPIQVFGPETHMTSVVPLAIDYLRRGKK